MKIYKVSIRKFENIIENLVFDYYDSFIIYANNEQQAKKICSKNAGSEGEKIWLKKSNVELIGYNLKIKKEEIILGSFNAG